MSELAIDQTPFFRFVSMVAKKPVDDPQFKFTEKRQSWMKRYCYVVGHQVLGGGTSFDDASFQNFDDTGNNVLTKPLLLEIL
jgi:hypothetical protein